jgi:hypothetical protein
MTSSSMNTSNASTVPFFVLRLDPPPAPTNENDNVQSDIRPNNVGMTDLPSTSLCRTKVLFTVPEHFATALIAHPILCCGSLFYLSFDEVDVSASSDTRSTTTSPQQPTNANLKNSKSNITITTPKTTFISTSYDSVDPDVTAYEIAKRIAIRLQNVRNTCLEQSQRPMNTNGNNTGEDVIDAVFVAKQNDWAAQMLF